MPQRRTRCLPAARCYAPTGGCPGLPGRWTHDRGGDHWDMGTSPPTNALPPHTLSPHCPEISWQTRPLCFNKKHACSSSDRRGTIGHFNSSCFYISGYFEEVIKYLLNEKHEVFSLICTKDITTRALVMELTTFIMY